MHPPLPMQLERISTKSFSEKSPSDPLRWILLSPWIHHWRYKLQFSSSTNQSLAMIVCNVHNFVSVACLQVSQITRAYRWAPFVPIQTDDSMFTVLLLLSKFRLRSIPVVHHSDPTVKNVITQSAVVRGLGQCRGRDWFDSFASKTLHQLGLPIMPPEKVSNFVSQSICKTFDNIFHRPSRICDGFRSS